MSQVSAEFIPTRIAILTVSNRRGEEDDTSGHYAVPPMKQAAMASISNSIPACAVAEASLE